MKQNRTKFFSLLLAWMLLLSACGQSDDTEKPDDQPLTLTIRTGEKQTTLDPADSTAAGSETILFHLYENLMRWEDDGNGFAKLAPGQAASYEVETDYEGNATYTFTLRDDIFWSNGDPVTAQHFVGAWLRLADPYFNSTHRELLRVVSGYDIVQECGDITALGISAPDPLTFIVTLNGNPPYFLEEVCASAYTMPAHVTVVSEKDPFITNGAYLVQNFSSNQVSLRKNEFYYDCDNVIAKEIHFIPSTNSQADYDAFLNAQADLVEHLPLSVLQELKESGNWTSEPTTGTYGVVFNTLQSPFDNADIRTALHLVIDKQAVVDALGDYTSRPAVGLIPYGITDYGVRHMETAPQTETNASLPDPNAPQQPTVQAPATLWDFRAHSQKIVTMNTGTDYAADCLRAKTLLSQAGYHAGKDFPPVEYIYVSSPENKIVAQTLQAIWKEQLGITVTLRALTQAEYNQMLSAPIPEDESDETFVAIPDFQMAGMSLYTDYNDAGTLLSRWYSTDESNCSGYSSEAFDILINASRVARSPETYDAYFHDAEAILLADSPVIPIYFHGTSFAFSDHLKGLYRSPNGVYFLTKVSRESR